MSQRGSTKLLFVALIVASSCLAIVEIAAFNSNAQVVRGIVVRLLWLALLAFVLHLHIRHIGDWTANIRLLHSVAKNIVGIRGISEHEPLLETVVERIAGDFGYAHVNIFCLQSDGSLKCVAGSSQAGHSLSEEGYCLERGKGIIGHVAATQEVYLSNNAEIDKHFYKHPSFPHTKAELAVPIRIRQQVVGVLDVQAHKSGVFLPHDTEVMQLMADYIGVVVDNIRVHDEQRRQIESRQRISKIIESIAHHFLSQHELMATLDEIALAALTELGADLVVLYARDPSTGEVTGPVYAGEAYHPQFLKQTPPDRDSLVHRLLSARDDYYFQADVQKGQVDPLFGPSEFHTRTGVPIFVNREKVRSRAIIRLRGNVGSVGLMFLNFRSPRSFDDPEEQYTFDAFGHLAALAIEKAQGHERQLRVEREDLACRLHDQLVGSADAANRLISIVVREAELADEHRSRLMHAQSALRELQSDIEYLNNSLKDRSSGDLRHEVDKLVSRAKAAYGIAFGVQWRGVSGQVHPRTVSEIKMILSEAILNAVRHGEATKLDLGIVMDDHQIGLLIQDNGQGFDASRVKPRGLHNMRRRAQTLGGTCSIESAPGEGTRINVAVPNLIARGT
ncbi:MAG: GAF domain-containing protein [Promethearchaeota archaeon]